MAYRHLPGSAGALHAGHWHFRQFAALPASKPLEREADRQGFAPPRARTPLEAEAHLPGDRARRALSARADLGAGPVQEIVAGAAFSGKHYRSRRELCAVIGLRRQEADAASAEARARPTGRGTSA